MMELIKGKLNSNLYALLRSTTWSVKTFLLQRPGDSYPTFLAGIFLSLFTWWQTTQEILVEVKFQSVEQGTNCQILH
jgi:hypothetical protein